MRIEATPRTRAGSLAVSIYGRVLEAVRGDRLVERFVHVDGNRLTVQDRSYDLARYRRVFVAGAGKASVEMASALIKRLGGRVDGGLIVTKEGQKADLPGIEVIEAGHPVPNEASLEAGRRMWQFAEARDEDDLVLFVLSGGASALMELPAGDLSLEDIQTTNRTLLASGADIATMNSVRAQLSRLKAGGLARAFGSATVIALVLSDVIGNSLATIGSGPLVAPRPLPEIPSNLLDSLPSAVRMELLSGALLPRTIPSIPHFVVGSLSVAVHAAADAARSMGLDPLPFADPMQGEARDMARQIMALAKRHVEARPTDEFCMIFGGETTVTLRGKGKGGRAQEMALAAASKVAKLPDLAILVAGTDGTDGPTNAAGGLVESDSLERAKAKGIDPRKALVANDSYAFLKASAGLVVTGPTGSNVNDLCLVVHAKNVKAAPSG